MVAVFFQDTVAFLAEPLVGVTAVAYGCPTCTFDLQIESHTVGNGEGCFGRTPGVETDMVQTVCFTLVIYFCPVSAIRSRISGQWEYTAFQGSPEEYRVAVYFETCTVCLELAEAESTVLLLFLSVTLYDST